MIGTKCKKCGKTYKLKDTAAGKNINCECGNVVAIPTKPNLDENGERIRPSQAASNEKKEEVQENAETKENSNKRREFADLTNKKVCSKCKNIFNMDIKECPKCGFNSMGVKYDQTRREEISRKVSQKIYHVGKYVIPATIMIVMITMFKMQLSKLEELKKFEKKVINIIKIEMNKLNEEKTKDPNADTLLNYYLVDDIDMPYFIAVPKKSDSSQFSFFGNGFFTMKNAGVCYELKYNKGNRKVKNYYIEDERGNPKIINPRDYEMHAFESIAYKLVGM